MITMSESRDRIASVMEGSDWWRFSITAEDIYKDFSDILEKAVEKRSREVGENISDIEYKEKFKSKVVEILQQSEEEIERGLINCVISGTKKTLINSGLDAKSLDEPQILHDNKTVGYVRQDMTSLGKTVIENFISNLTLAINDILEEI